MTEPATTPEPVENVDAAPADPSGDAPETDAGGEQSGPNREAAKWRKQLRTVEAERDGLRERVTAFERAEVERLAADRLADPADLWTGGVDLESLRGKDGIDAAKVGKAVDAILRSHPHWQRAQKQRPAVGSLRSGATGASVDSLGTSWAEVFGASRERR
ncbi:hypothetical protein IU459_10815 [Nocardia amamiensis]|uniref:Scaffolding protein n=1 Tax=Nocardia amamiensis TaxID=404578 RepID=A0ABS0CQH8_9NOCA|nr:hypothetical protein [Nocardia amamiensis]MBF6298038.1 hypothetical protein [Nocardia amamiensis]